MDKGTAGEIILVIVHVQGIAPPDVKAEGIEGLLVTEVVPFLKETQAQKAGDAEVGPAGRTVQNCIPVFVPEQDGEYFISEQLSP